MNNLFKEDIPEVLMQADGDGHTAVHLAAKSGSPEVIMH